jgi:transposase
MKLQKSPSKTLEMLKTVYGESIISMSNIFKWHKHFREGRKDVNDKEKQGAPIMTRKDKNIIKIKELVRSDCWFTCRMIADEFDISKETVRKILIQDLGMRKLAMKLVL